MMATLPHHAYLGIEQPNVRALEWFIACVERKEYDLIQDVLKEGRHFLNPFEAFERVIRSHQPMDNYKKGLDYAQAFFPEHTGVVKQSTRWMLRWEMDLTKTIGRILVGGPVIEDSQRSAPEKSVAYSLLSIQMMASNWENPKYVARWKDRLSYREDLTDERRQTAAAQSYWKLLQSMDSDWQQIAVEGIQARVNPKHMPSLEIALQRSRTLLEQRTAVTLPNLPGLVNVPAH